MPGLITTKELTVVVLQNDNGTSVSNNASGVAATQFDNRSGGNGAQSFWANFELKAGFGSAPTIGLTVDLYLVPRIDGTNLADVGASAQTFQPNHNKGSFYIVLSQTGVQRMTISAALLMPLLYDAYLLNKSGQTMSTNWGLRVVPVQQQYT